MAKWWEFEAEEENPETGKKVVGNPFVLATSGYGQVPAVTPRVEKVVEQGGGFSLPQVEAQGDKPWWVDEVAKNVKKGLEVWEKLGKPELPPWLQKGLQFGTFMAEGTGRRISEAWKQPEERQWLAPVEVPSWGEVEKEKLAALPSWAEWNPYLRQMAQTQARIEQGKKAWEQMTQKSKLARGIEQVGAVGMEVLNEPAIAAEEVLGASALASRAKAKGLSVREWAPLTERAYSLGGGQVEEVARAVLEGRLGSERDLVEEALTRVQRGEKAAEVATEQERMGWELVGQMALDPLNVLDVLGVGAKAKQGMELSKAERLMLKATATDNEVQTLRRALAGQGAAEVAALEKSGLWAGLGEKGKGALKKLARPVEYLFELTPAAKADRDLGEMFIVSGGVLGEAGSADEAVGLVKTWAQNPGALTGRLGGTVESAAGQKAGLIFGALGDEVERLPSVVAARAGEAFNPAKFMVELTEAGEGVLRTAYGYEEPGRVMKFLNGYKALQSEFYLTGLWSPGYVTRNAASDLFTMAVDGVGTFERRTNINAFFDRLGITSRRVTTGGKGAKEALTGIQEGKSVLPGVLGMVSEKGQEITRYAEPLGRLPLGEEPRYQRAFYKSLSRFLDQNAMARTPDLPSAVRQVLGNEAADNLMAAVARGVNGKEKVAAVKRVLAARSPVEGVELTKFLDVETMDAMSPELYARLRRELDALPLEAGPEDVQRVFDRARGWVDEFEGQALGQVEGGPVPGRTVASDVEEGEIAEQVIVDLQGQLRRMPPELRAQYEGQVAELERRIADLEAELADARAIAVEMGKAQGGDEGLEVLLAANRDVDRMRDDVRRVMDGLLRETVEAYKAGGPELGHTIWPPYFQEAARRWSEQAGKRIGRFQEAQQQLQRLYAGEALEDVLGMGRRELAELRLRQSIVDPELEQVLAGVPGWEPGGVLWGEEERFQKFLAAKRAEQDQAAAMAWRSGFGADRAQYGDVLDVLDSSARHVEWYGKKTAGEVAIARQAFLDEVESIKATKGKPGPYIKRAHEQYIKQRNYLWNEHQKLVLGRWEQGTVDVQRLGGGQRIGGVGLVAEAKPGERAARLQDAGLKSGVMNPEGTVRVEYRKPAAGAVDQGFEVDYLDGQGKVLETRPAASEGEAQRLAEMGQREADLRARAVPSGEQSVVGLHQVPEGSVKVKVTKRGARWELQYYDVQGRMLEAYDFGANYPAAKAAKNRAELIVEQRGRRGVERAAGDFEEWEREWQAEMRAGEEAERARQAAPVDVEDAARKWGMEPGSMSDEEWGRLSFELRMEANKAEEMSTAAGLDAMADRAAHTGEKVNVEIGGYSREARKRTMTRSAQEEYRRGLMGEWVDDARGFYTRKKAESNWLNDLADDALVKAGGGEVEERVMPAVLGERPVQVVEQERQLQAVMDEVEEARRAVAEIGEVGVEEGQVSRMEAGRRRRRLSVAERRLEDEVQKARGMGIDVGEAERRMGGIGGSEEGRQAFNAGVVEPGATMGPERAAMVQAQAVGTRRAIEQMEQGLLGAWDVWQPAVEDAAVQRVVAAWLEEMVMPAWAETRAVGMQYAKGMSDFALLDYRKRRRLDTWISLVAPYSYWYTRSGWNWAQRLAGRPGMLAQYLRAREAMRLANEQAGRRARFEGTVKVPFPWLPDWMGESVYVDPLRMVVPFSSFVDTDWEDAGEARVGLQKVFDLANRWGMRPYHFLELPFKAGWVAEAGEAMGMEKAMAERYLGPAVPGEFGTVLPQSRVVKGLTALAREAGVEAIPPGGVNLEAPVRRLLGLPAGEAWDPYRVGRMLANMAAETGGGQDYETARAALMAQELLRRDEMQTGQVWSAESELARETAVELGWSVAELDRAQALLREAMQRAALEQGVGAVGWALGPGMAVEPTGERARLELMEQARGQAWSPETPEGSYAGYQTFKREYPAVYPHGTQYGLVPGGEAEYMTAGARANWLAADRAKAQVNEMYDKRVDALLRQDPTDWEGWNALEEERQAALEAVKKRYPYEAGEWEAERVGGVLVPGWGRTPGEYAEEVVADEVARVKETAPKPEDFSNSDGSVDWGAYYEAREGWLADLPKEGQGWTQIKGLGGRYAGLTLADAVEAYGQRYDSPLEAVARVYKDEVMGEAQAEYRRLKALQEKQWPGMAALNQEYHKLPEGGVERKAFLDEHSKLREYWDWKGAEEERRWPGMKDLESAYFDLPKGGAERKAFLAEHPKLKAYWDWKDEVVQQWPGMKGLEEAYYDLPEGNTERREFLKKHPRLKEYWAWQDEQGPSPYERTVGAIGSVRAEELIPQVLARYRASGWTEAELWRTLAGVVFGEGEGATDTSKGTGGKAEKGAGGVGEAGVGEVGEGLGGGRWSVGAGAVGVGEDWRSAFGRPWWEYQGRGLQPVAGGRSRGGGGGTRRAASQGVQNGGATGAAGATDGAMAVDPVEAQAKAEYRQLMEIVEQQWPGVQALEEAYWQVPAEQRQAFLAMYPALREYWEFRDTWWASHPVGAGFYGKTTAEVEGVPGSWVGGESAGSWSGGSGSSSSGGRWTRREVMYGGPRWSR